MKDTLNKLDPLLLTLGEVIRPKPITDAEIKQQALYRFEKVCHDLTVVSGCQPVGREEAAAFAESQAEQQFKVGDRFRLTGFMGVERFEVGHMGTVTRADNGRPVLGTLDGDGTTWSLNRNFIELVPEQPKADADGWIEWNGGECPLLGKTLHEVRFRDGVIHQDNRPSSWTWRHDGDGCDIVAYRVL